MLYSFTGGPLHGQTIDVPHERIVDNTFTHITFGKYKSPFHLLPETIEHRYMPVNDQMIYCKPAKLA